MSERIVTYHSTNAGAGKAWVAYVDLGHDYLGIRFEGATEEEAYVKASDFWAKDQAKRDEVKASREEARRKAAETRARKQSEAA
jgi:hypothetical protein